MTARILECTVDEYHRLPGLSGSFAKTMLSQSPMHAKYERDHGGKSPSKVMDLGAVMHRMALGKGKEYACLPFDDWTTKAAKESRDKTRAAGLIPLTHVQHTKCEEAAASARRAMAELGIALDGQSELAVEWFEDDVQCRCMFDHVNLETGEILELKFTGDANPVRMERHVEEMGYRISSAAYIRALLALRPELRGKISYTFLFCEMDAPYAVYPPDPDYLFLETGERDWLRAVAMHRECTRTGRWPGYQDFRSIGRPQWKLKQEGYANE